MADVVRDSLDLSYLYLPVMEDGGLGTDGGEGLLALDPGGTVEFREDESDLLEDIAILEGPVDAEELVTEEALESPKASKKLDSVVPAVEVLLAEVRVAGGAPKSEAAASTLGSLTLVDLARASL